MKIFSDADYTRYLRGYTDWDSERLPVGSKGLEVLLRRIKPRGQKLERAVLLLPGANSSCDTFLMPEGGLAAYLRDHGCDVWMLDWRASPLVLKNHANIARAFGGDAEDERRAFTLDHMVAEDLPAALTFIRRKIGAQPLSVHGHCVGGGGVAMAIARGILAPFDVDNVVLSTLGLFYEVPWGTWLKAEDYLLERMLLDDANSTLIDPHPKATWPKAYRSAFDAWPLEWLRASDEFLRRLSFMVGTPYARDKLAPRISTLVDGVFGSLHVGLYIHLAQIVRRGFSGQYDLQDHIDRVRLYRGEQSRPAPRGDLILDPFVGYNKITLVGAGDNGVWHRDSIDLMYEWLRRDPRIHCEKRVFAGYNIQELYWGSDAREKVYPYFAAGIMAGPRPAGQARRPAA
jgi:hypothetical protein